MSQSDRPEVGEEREREREEEDGKRERRGSKKQKGKKLEGEAFLAPCMDFELAACMFSPIPWPGPPKRCRFAADPGQKGYLRICCGPAGRPRPYRRS
jgi:hypothetical protein